METERIMNPDLWYLQAPNGHEYGPVPFDRLRIWAAQNRFAAGYRISRDRSEWQAVETVPELGMDWYVQTAAGARYGPFHPLALLDYVREGAIPPEAVVVHKGKGGTARAYQVLLEAVVDAIDQTAEDQAALFEQVAQLREELEAQTRARQAAEEERDALRQQVREWNDRQATWEAERTRQRAELEAAAQEREHLKAEQEREAENARRAQAAAVEWEQRARVAFEAADRRVAEAERRWADTERRLEEERREWKRRVETLQADLTRARQASEAPEREVARLRVEIEAWKRRWEEIQQERLELLRLREERESREREWTRRAEEAEAQRRQLESERETARRAAEEAASAAQQALERVRFLEAELQSAQARLASVERTRPPDRPAPEVPVVEIETTAHEKTSSKTPPPPRPASLISLEARAQAELRAWQSRRKNAPPLDDEKAPPKITSWFPWKKS